MRATVEKCGHEFSVLVGDGELRSPRGTPVRTRYESLANAIAREVQRHGPRMSKAILFALQCSYLDFGLSTPRPELQRAVMWDWFAHEAPGALVPHSELGLPTPAGAEDLAAILSELSLRQLMTIVFLHGNEYSTVSAAVKLVTSARTVPELSRGSCSRFKDLAGRISISPQVPYDSCDQRIYTAPGYDRSYRGRCLAPSTADESVFADRSPVGHVYEKARFFASIDDE